MYQPLGVDTGHPVLNALLAAAEDYLEEVHWLLATAHLDQGPSHLFQISVALNLLSVVNGLASPPTVRLQNNESAFVTCLETYLPWEKCGVKGISRAGAQHILYNLCRNPLAHGFGFSPSRKRIKYGHSFPGTADAEVRIVGVEVADTPHKNAFLEYRTDAIVLWLDAFYWAVRQMVRRYFSDPDKLAELRKYLIATPTGTVMQSAKTTLVASYTASPVQGGSSGLDKSGPADA